ncbi:MAG: LEPR-XLL domain-containing protein, partial [Gemmatimonadales bacterium]
MLDDGTTRKTSRLKAAPPEGSMLRQLLGFARSRRILSRKPAAESAPSAPRFRRKPVFEALENRLLLSADPVALFNPEGLLALALGDGDDGAIVERLGTSAAGGDIVAVTIGTATQHFGDSLFGVMRLLIDAGAGNDWLRIIGITVATDITGGLGTDTFEYQHGDATWSITALDTGRVGTVGFSAFEHLVGGDDSADTFLFA